MDILAFLRERASAFRCPMCRRSLADCKLRELDHEGRRYTVEVTCRNCELAFLVALELTSGDEFEMGAAADAEVTGEEESEPAPPPISSDELLEVHQRLSGYTGRLTALLAEPTHD